MADHAAIGRGDDDGAAARALEIIQTSCNRSNHTEPDTRAFRCFQ
jgi:hypothetical protein